MITAFLASRPSSNLSYQGPLDLVTGASIAFSQRALRSATRGAPLYTIRRGSDNTTQVFNSDAITGAAPISAIESFVGARFGISDFVIVESSGTGYDDGATPSTFDVSLAGGTGTAAVMNVSTDGTGAVTTINSVTNFGDYSVVPSSPNFPTGDDGVNHGTGLQVSCRFSRMAFVSTWNDQSGHSKNATQATAANQPLWLPSAANSLPGVGFSSFFEQALNTGDVTFANSDFTVFCVLAVSVPNFGNGTVLIGNAPGDNGPDFGMQVFGGMANSPTFYSDDEGFNNGNGGQLDGSAISNFVYYVLDASWGSATLVSGSLDGTTLSLTTNFIYGDGISMPGMMPMTIGGGDPLAPTNWLTGVVVELVVYNKLVADRAPIRQNMMAYYGITPYVGPLDIVPGAVAAFSLRALSVAWVADVITIRRDNDNETQSFAPISNNGVDAADVVAFLGAAAGFATAWKDQSGNANDVMQATHGTQPIWSASGGPNSRPCLTADGDRILQSAGNVTLPGGAYTTFFVLRMDEQTNQAGNIWGVNQDYSAYVIVSVGAVGDLSVNAINVDAWDGSNEAGGQSASFAGADRFAIYDTAWAFGDHNYAKDGIDLGQVNDRDSGGALSDITQPLAIMANSTTDGPGGGMSGAVCEVLIYPGLMSDPDRTAIRENIATYYGISS